MRPKETTEQQFWKESPSRLGSMNWCSNIEVKLTSTFILTSQACKQHTKSDLNQAQVACDQEQRVETKRPDWCPPFSSSSTGVSPDVGIRPPGIPLSAHPQPKPTISSINSQRREFRSVQTARQSRGRHAEAALAVERTELRLPQICGHDESTPQGSQIKIKSRDCITKVQ